MATGAASRIDLAWTHTIKTGYRIDVSEDGIKWQERERNTGLTLELNTTDQHTYEHEDGIDPGDVRHYRVFANDGDIYGNAPAAPVMTMAGEAEAPSGVRRVTARAVNAGQIDLSWSAPEKDGGADIEAYLVQISVDGTTWVPADNDVASFVTRTAGVSTRLDSAFDTDGNGHDWVTKTDANDNVITTYSHTKLTHETRFYYRVLADNGTELTEVGDANAQTAATPKASMPGAPGSLSAHPAADSSLGDPDKQGVYLTWLAPSDPAGAAIDDYEIVRMITGEDDFVDTVAASGTDPRTFYNDNEELGDQVRRYRVRGINDAGNGGWSTTVTYPLADEHTHPPASTALTAPSGVMATVGVTDPGAITVTWTPGENATGGHLVLLFNSDFTEVPHIGVPTETEEEEGMYTIPVVTTAATTWLSWCRSSPGRSTCTTTPGSTSRNLGETGNSRPVRSGREFPNRTQFGK